MKEKIDGMKSTLTKNVDELNELYSDGVVDGFTEQLLGILGWQIKSFITGHTLKSFSQGWRHL